MKATWKEVKFVDIIRHATGRTIDATATLTTPLSIPHGGTVHDVVGFTDGSFVAIGYTDACGGDDGSTWFNGEQYTFIMEAE